jgi:hypothetical protein
MGEMVNLRRARRGKAREDAWRPANRRKFGVTLAARDAMRAEQDLAARRLDAHQREGARSPADCDWPPGNRGDGD